MTTPTTRWRRLLLAGGLAVLLAAATIGALVLTRPPAPPNPLTAEGLFPVPVPRTVENVDLCTLLTDDEAAALIGPGSTRWPYQGDVCTYGGLSSRRGNLDIIRSGDTTGYTTPEYGPNTTIAGYPAILKVPEGYLYCSATIIVEPEPSRSALSLQWRTNPDCESLRRAAELIIPRLPLAPG